ncbi:MAG: transcriptional repressor [Methylococcales bacterium]|nr:transcriptional repressor [Methylococcales bacterium]
MTPPASQQDHDHNHCVESALKLAQTLCQQRGAQLTPLRQKILELIWANHRAVKAYDLLEQIKPFNDSAKPATVYRSLDFLLAQGLVHRIESLNAYIGCNHAERPHDIILLICHHCQQIEERHAAGVMLSLQQELTDAGFTPSGKTMEIHGTCRQCAPEKDQAME